MIQRTIKTFLNKTVEILVTYKLTSHSVRPVAQNSEYWKYVFKINENITK
jgi:hypothetical protein